MLLRIQHYFGWLIVPSYVEWGKDSGARLEIFSTYARIRQSSLSLEQPRREEIEREGRLKVSIPCGHLGSRASNINSRSVRSKAFLGQLSPLPHWP